MTPDTLAKHIATLPTLPCGCTVGHEHRCPVAVALWGMVAGERDEDGKLVKAGLWTKYKNAPATWRERYFAATRKYLAHFENGHAPQPPQPQPRQGALL